MEFSEQRKNLLDKWDMSLPVLYAGRRIRTEDTVMGIGNKRLEAMLPMAMGLKGGRYVLDCFMGRCIRYEFIHTITTRTAEDKNTWVLEIYE